MADASLQIGNGNWGVKTSLLLGYNVVSNRYNPIEIGVTRETLGSRTNQDGIIDYKDNNIARINYASGVGSLLLEPQRTNLLNYSEQFDQSYWSKTRCTITPNSTNSPNGTLTADTLVGNSSGVAENYVFVPQNATINVPNVFSVYIKPINVTNVRLVSFTQNGSSTFSLVGGGSVISNIGICSGGLIESLQNGWYRISTKITPTATGSNNIGISTSGLGIVGDCFYIWGAQLEQGSYATSYIPTTTSATTRNQDVISRSGISDLINSVEGVFFTEISALNNDGTLRRITLNDGSGAIYNRIIIEFSGTANTIRVILFTNIIIYDFSYTIPNALNFTKIAFKYSVNNFKVFVNGVLVNTGLTGVTFPINLLNTLSFSDSNNLSNFYGNCKQVQLYKTLLTDTECINLTTL